MKKLVILAVSLFMLVGCAGKPEANKKRGTDYEFDFVDYIEITEYGENGSGYIEVIPRDISLEDFYSEEDYIKVKHDLDNMNLVFQNGRYESTALKISKTEELSNGDVITLKIGMKPENLQSDINIEDYEYQVMGLKESQPIDLFGSDLVTFFVTTEGNVWYHVKDNKNLPEELIKNIKYTIRYDGEAELNKSILQVEADMDETFLKESGYYSLPVFLAKHDLKADLSSEKVLVNLVEPIEFSSATSSAVETELYDAIGAEETDLSKVCNIQQLERQKVAEPYTYYITYYNTVGGEREYFRRAVILLGVDGEYVVYKLGGRESTQEQYTKSAYDNAEILLDFMMGDE